MPQREISAHSDVLIREISLPNLMSSNLLDAEVVVVFAFDPNELNSGAGAINKATSRRDPKLRVPLFIVPVSTAVPAIDRCEIAEKLTNAGAMVLNVDGPVDSEHKDAILIRVKALFDSQMGPKFEPSRISLQNDQDFVSVDQDQLWGTGQSPTLEAEALVTKSGH
jgi:hypothetical protein